MSGSDTSARRRPRPVVIIAAVLLVAVAGVVAYLLLGQGEQEAAEPHTPDPITTTLAPPSPAGEPIDQDASTALGEALPDVVLDHVLTAQSAQEDQAADLGAFEAWAMTYSAPGSDIEVQVIQWHEADEAEEYLDELTEEPAGWVDGQGRRSGDVAVAGESVGRYEIGVVQDAGATEPPSTPGEDDAGGDADSDADSGQASAQEELADTAVPEPLGPGRALWHNGSVVFVATGDAARLALFYDNFPY